MDINKYNFKEYIIDNKKYVSMAEVVKYIGVAQNNTKAKHPLFEKYVIKGNIETSNGKKIANLIESSMINIYIDSFIRKTNKDEVGVIYIVRYADNIYKIGCAKDFNIRFKTLKSSYPFDLEVIHTIQVSNYYDIEQKIHKKYKDFLIKDKKEFFKLSDSKLKGLICVLNNYKTKIKNN